MKAAVLHQIKSRFRLETVADPQIGPDEVLVETHTCGICRTDLHIQDGLAYVPSLPHIPGHEPAGVIAAIGERVAGLRVGQRVVPHLFLTCGHCRYCRTGRDSQCSHVQGILGVTLPGGFAEYFKAPARNLLPLPDNVSFEAGGIVSCGVITAVHAYRRARLAVNDVAVVLGVGGIGQMLVQILRRSGIRTVAVGRNPQSLAAARQAGAELCVPLGKAEAVEQIREFAGGEGAAAIFECVGTADTMKFAAQAARRGGQIVVIGEEAEFPAVDTIQIAQRELEIIGSRNGSIQDAADALGLISAGIIQPPIAARFPLSQLNEALQTLRDGHASGRLVIHVR
jgi:propanol-preferring alcohol dehydrogenase